MMITFIHPKLGRVSLPVTQVVVSDDVGRPLAISYQEAGAVIHSDLNDSDFSQICGNLGLKYEAAERLLLKA